MLDIVIIEGLISTCIMLSFVTNFTINTGKDFVSAAGSHATTVRFFFFFLFLKNINLNNKFVDDLNVSW